MTVIKGTCGLWEAGSKVEAGWCKFLLHIRLLVAGSASASCEGNDAECMGREEGSAEGKLVEGEEEEEEEAWGGAM
jgi:hypothetical protein